MSFETWLCECLNAAGLDGVVFGEYINGALGTLESSTSDEMEDSLLEILQGCVENDLVCQNMCKEILKEWVKEKERMKETKCKSEQEVDLTLHQGSHTHQHEDCTLQKSVPKEKDILSVEEKRRLIAQYDCESDEEQPTKMIKCLKKFHEKAQLEKTFKESESSHSEEKQKTGAVFVNRNAATVSDAERQHREKMKTEHETRMDKQRQDRENQKQKAQDRKEKEKKRTQKQEKRR